VGTLGMGGETDRVKERECGRCTLYTCMRLE
jgi:hypothetical protein